MTAANASLASSARLQLRVLRALLLREVLTRYGRHNIGFLWLFVEPMLFTLGVMTLWTLGGFHNISNLPIVAFALTGYSAVLLWRNMPARCVGAISSNSALMYHRNVRVIDIYLARVLLEAIGATMSFAILSIVFISLEWIAPPEDLVLLAGGWALTACFGSSFAILLGAWSEKSEILEKLWHPAVYILFPLAGAAYLVESLPSKFRDIVMWLPMVHCGEMIRDGYFGSKFTAHYDIGYIIAVTIGMMALGLALERRVSREYVVE
jgi:ABC-type polysaccharide/polyol phosphate export permease